MRGRLYAACGVVVNGSLLSNAMSRRAECCLGWRNDNKTDAEPGLLYIRERRMRREEKARLPTRGIKDATSKVKVLLSGLIVFVECSQSKTRQEHYHNHTTNFS